MYKVSKIVTHEIEQIKKAKEIYKKATDIKGFNYAVEKSSLKKYPSIIEYGVKGKGVDSKNILIYSDDEKLLLMIHDMFSIVEKMADDGELTEYDLELVNPLYYDWYGIDIL